MASADRTAVSRLFRATFLFGTSCGVSLALTSLLLQPYFSKSELGTLATINGLGIVANAVPTSWLARTIGSRRALVTYLVAYAICGAALPFLHGGTAIAVDRFFDGAASVGVWISSETLLLANARGKDKANLTSQYAIWLVSGYVGGSFVAEIFGGRTAFFLVPLAGEQTDNRLAYLVAASFALAAATFVALFVPMTNATTSDAREAAGDRASEAGADAHVAASSAPLLTARELLTRIRCSCFGTFAYGYFQAGVVVFLPLYLMQSKGIAEHQVKLVTGIFCVGMLVASNPVGRVADRIGHLRMMRILAVVGTVMIGGFVALSSWPPMAAAVFIAGATIAAMSPVSLALQGVVTPPRQYVRANGLYNLFYASGILVGPFVSGKLFERFGGGVMLAHLALLWVAFIVYATVHAGDDPAHARRVAG